VGCVTERRSSGRGRWKLAWLVRGVAIAIYELDVHALTRFREGAEGINAISVLHKPSGGTASMHGGWLKAEARFREVGG
jgi:hypothetical protein